MNQVVVADSRAIATAQSKGVYAVALDELTGEELWRREFVGATATTPPTLDHGNVYVSWKSQGYESYISSLDAATGDIHWSSAFDRNFLTSLAPTVAGGAVWVSARTATGIYGFDQTDGRTLALEQYPANDYSTQPFVLTPSLYDGRLYSYTGGLFAEHSASNGAVEWSVALRPPVWPKSNPESRIAAIADGRAFIVDSYGLHAVDLEARELLWSVAENLSNMPAIAGDDVYVIHNGLLKVYDADTGQPTGVFPADDVLDPEQPIVTDDAVIVSSRGTKIIFGRASHTALLKITADGVMSVANDTLYAASDDGTVTAIHLNFSPPLLLNWGLETTEGQSGDPLEGVVRVHSPVATDLPVRLTSENENEVTVPPFVTLAAGTTEARFPITVIDDHDWDFARPVLIRASAEGYRSDAGMVWVNDNDGVPLELIVPTSLREGDKVAVNAGMIRVPIAPTQDVDISLTSNNDLLLPTNVKLRAGSTEVRFDIGVNDDDTVEGPVSVKVRATWDAAISGGLMVQDRVYSELLLLDNEVPSLTLSIPESVTEGDGYFAGRLTIPYPQETDVVISLKSPVPDTVWVRERVTIPAGQTSIEFDLKVFDDNQWDAFQRVELSATANGFRDANSRLAIVNDDPTTLSIVLPTELSEADGIVSRRAKILVGTPPKSGVSLRLDSSLPDVLDLPLDVWLPAGATSVTFDLTIRDNERVESDQVVVVSYSGLLGEASQAVIIRDDDIIGLDGDWSTWGGGPNHNGYFPGHVGTTPRGAQLRWLVDLHVPMNPVAIADGRVYATTSGNGTEQFLVALDERTGVELWRREFESDSTLSAPTIEEGTVYVSQDERGIYGFDENDGELLYSPESPAAAGWAPSYADGKVYSQTAGIFSEHSPTTGATLWSVDLGGNNSHSSPPGVVVVAGNRALLTGDGGLQAVNLQAHQVAWSISSGSWGVPAVNRDMIYVVKAGVLYSYHAAFGSIDSSYTTQGTFRPWQPIVTDDAVIVSTMQETLVLDKELKQRLVVIPVSGRVSLANNRLYVAADDGRLVVFDLLLLPSLRLSGSASAVEGQVPATLDWSVSVEKPVENDLVVNLVSNNPRVVVPAAVTIAAGASWVTFPITIVDDEELEGTEVLEVMVSASGYHEDVKTVVVEDNETNELQISLPMALREGDGAVGGGGTIIAAVAPSRDIPISLTTDVARQVAFPPSVILRAGTTSVRFEVLAVDDSQVDGAADVTITASVDGWTGDAAKIRVHDNDDRFLMVTMPDSATEGVGSVTARIDLPYPPSSDLEIFLGSDNWYQAFPPRTVSILAGETSVAFPVSIVDDNWLDGSQNVVILATAAGYRAEQAALLVHDNERTSLRIVAPDQLDETEGVLSGQSKVVVAEALDHDVVVRLASDSVGDLMVPGSVTIPAGATEAEFDLTVLQNPYSGGARRVELTASVVGWQSEPAYVNVFYKNLGSLTGDWHPEGNGPGHSGYYPGVVGAKPQFEPLWSIPLGNGNGSGVSQSAVVDGRVYVTHDFGGVFALALDAQTGVELWRREIPRAIAVGTPTVVDGRVCVAVRVATKQTEVVVLDAANGDDVWRSYIGSEWGPLGTPTVADERVWIVVDPLMSVMSFELDSRTNGNYLRYDEVSRGIPSFENGLYYTFTAGVFSAQRSDFPIRSWSLPLEESLFSRPDTSVTPTYPVSAIQDGRAVVIGNLGLHAVDLRTHQPLWTVPQSFQGVPAIAGDQVFVVQNGQLKNFRVDTGQLVATFEALAPIQARQPIVTDDAVIVSTDRDTLFFQRRTGALLMTIPAAGKLSLSDDTLYVASADGRLSAFRLPIVNQLMLSGATEGTEGQTPQALTWTISVAAPVTADLVVQLGSSNIREIVVPQTVTIRAGTSSAEFTASVVDDVEFDGARIVQLSARARGYRSVAADVTVLDDDIPTLRLVLPESWREGDDLLQAGGIITSSVAPSRDVSIDLVSNQPSLVGVPNQVTLRAGSLSTNFDLNIADDSFADGPGFVAITASVTGWTEVAQVRVDDDETPFLTLIRPTAATEGDGNLSVSIELPFATETDLDIALISGDDSELILPTKVVVAAGMNSVRFNVLIVDDGLLDGSQSISMSATAPGYRAAQATFIVHDNETTTLSLSLPTEVNESAGTLTGQGKIYVAVPPDKDLMVRLISSDTDAIRVPEAVIISAGAAEAVFDLTVIDNRQLDGDRQIMLIGTVAHSPPAVARVTSLDDERLGVVGEFPAFGNGPSHTGYIPGNLGPPAQTTVRWSTAPMYASEDFTSSPVIADGRVYIISHYGSTHAGTTTLTALDENTGTKLWSRNYDGRVATHPVFYAGNIYLQQLYESEDSPDNAAEIWSIDAVTGETNWSSSFQAGWYNNAALGPLVVDGGIWTTSSADGSIFGFDLADGEKRFKTDSTQCLGEFPAYYHGFLYAYHNGRFSECSPDTGNITWSIKYDWDLTHRRVPTVPVIADGVAFLIASDGVYAVDLETHQTRWSVPGKFTGVPAVEGGVVYVPHWGRVQAFRVDTGEQVGVFEVGASLASAQPILTSNAIIIATSKENYVFDRATQRLLMTLPFKGTLTVANNTLYDFSWGRLYAYDLTLALPSPRQNPAVHEDTTADGVVSPQDALFVINQLNRNGAGKLDALEGVESSGYFDVNGDQWLTPADVLLVVNYLNIVDTLVAPEGEAIDGTDALPGGPERTQFVGVLEPVRPEASWLPLNRRPLIPMPARGPWAALPRPPITPPSPADPQNISTDDVVTPDLLELLANDRLRLPASSIP